MGIDPLDTAHRSRAMSIPDHQPTALERGALLLGQIGIYGVVSFGTLLLGYLVIGTALVISDAVLLPYPHLSFQADPILNGILFSVGVSLICLNVGHALYTLLVTLGHSGRKMDVLIVVVLHFIAIGFGIGIARWTLPPVVEWLARIL